MFEDSEEYVLASSPRYGTTVKRKEQNDLRLLLNRKEWNKYEVDELLNGEE